MSNAGTEPNEAGRSEIAERFRAIVEATPVPIMIVGVSDKKILYANRRLEETFGVRHEELIGQTTPEFCNDPADHERLFDELARQGFVRDREIQARRADGSIFWLVVSAQPIRYRGESAAVAGFLDITQRRQAEESLKRERRLLQRLLDLNARDRQLIAYEIHDGLVQDMTGALMLLEAASDDVAPDNALAREHLQQCIKLLRDSVGEARRMIDGLRPPVLEEAGVVAAVENLIAEAAAGGDLSVALDVNVRFDRIAPTLEMAIYRIVQEALNNVRQHSDSPKAQVRLVQFGDHIGITVRDWGKGFDPENVKKKRYGLAGIRERARLLGGSVEIDSAPGRGARVQVELPLTDVLLPRDPPPAKGKGDDDSDTGSSSSWRI